MNTTWWRTHPVGHRLLAVLVCDVLLVAVGGGGFGQVLWLAVDVFLLHRIRRSSGVAWGVLLGLTVLAVGLGVYSVIALAATPAFIAAIVLNVAVGALLLTPTVRGWVARSGLMSLPGEH